MKIDMRPCPPVYHWAGYRSDHLRAEHADRVQRARDMSPIVDSTEDDDG